MNKHTPTPYHLWANTAGVVYLKDSHGRDIATFESRKDGKHNAEWIAEDKATRAFIVRAVNSHESLLSCLKGAMMIVKVLSSDNDTVFVKEAEQAIAKAEGKSND